jgi:outer membrane protein OmpA-like peptidoglycan-associated protein
MRKLSPSALFLFFLLLAGSSFGQTLKIKADREYARLRYARAIEHYELYVEKNKRDNPAKLKLALSYKKIQDTKNAERVFRSIDQLEGLGTDACLQFAEVLSQNGNYEEAHQWYTKLGKSDPSNDRAKKFTTAYKDLSQFYFDSARYKIFYLGFNSPQADFSPSYFKDGIVFSSGRLKEHGVRNVFAWDNSAFLDLFFTDTLGMSTLQHTTDRNLDKVSLDHEKARALRKKIHHDDTPHTSNDSRTLGFYGGTFSQDSAWKVVGRNAVVNNFSKNINTKYHEGPATFTKDQNTIFFTRNNYHQGTYGQSESEINKLKIYMATRTAAGEWENVKEFPYNTNNISMGHPALSPDDKTLYFVSDMPGGLGGTDLYKSVFENGAWGKPQNLGKEVNTEGNEMFPFVSERNQLFFASTGHGGLGGLDIFSCDLNAPKFQVTNLGFPVNSKKDDFGLIVNAAGTKGFFSSNRKRGGNDDDLFMFTCHQESKLLLYVYSTATKDTISGLPVVLYERGHEKELIEGTTKGKFTSYPVKEGKKYTAMVNADGTKVYKNISTPDRYFSSMKAGIPIPNYYNDKSKYPPLPGDENPVIAKGKDINSTDSLSAKQTDKKQSGGITLGKDGKPLVILTKEDCERYQKYKVLPIYYDFDKSAIRTDAVPLMQKVAGLINGGEGVEVLLSSHTDSRQTDAYNVALSARRSDAAYLWLLKNNIVANKISKEWQGEAHLANNCGNDVRCSPAAHQLNRRTEFYFTIQGVDVTKQCGFLGGERTVSVR